jgi:VIT1/CCC1 family predicted Fe2+/Mn2+ transporter
LYARIAAKVRTTPREPNSITKADFMGAFWSFWLVVLSSAPAAIPFLLIDDAHRALRFSNAILLAILFLTGYKWARYTLGNPWVVGLVFLSGGIGLVLMAIALGG